MYRLWWKSMKLAKLYGYCDLSRYFQIIRQQLIDSHYISNHSWPLQTHIQQFCPRNPNYLVMLCFFSYPKCFLKSLKLNNFLKKCSWTLHILPRVQDILYQKAWNIPMKCYQFIRLKYHKDTSNQSNQLLGREL